MEQEKRTFHATIIYGGTEARTRKGFELARKLVCSDPEHRPCGVCRDCRKVLEGIHPDVISVEQFMEDKDVGGEVKVKPIRALRNDVFIKPNEARRKVYLIQNAHQMNLSAQNSMLKVLEEGPDYAAFVLLSDSAGGLLETIRSRCALVNAGEDETDRAVSPHALEFARVLCGGSELERMGFLAGLESAKPDRSTLDDFLSGMEGLCCDAAIGGVTGRFSTDEAQLLSARRSRKELLDMADQIRRAREMAAFHVSAGHLLGWLGTQL